MYPEIMVVGMRDELKKMGVTELLTEEEVDRALTNQKGTAMVVVNSICGCAAGRMRPAVRAALQNTNVPDQVFSVFAGQDSRSHTACAQLFHRLSAVFAFGCIVAGWKVGPHASAE